MPQQFQQQRQEASRSADEEQTGGKRRYPAE